MLQGLNYIDELRTEPPQWVIYWWTLTAIAISTRWGRRLVSSVGVVRTRLDEVVHVRSSWIRAEHVAPGFLVSAICMIVGHFLPRSPHCGISSLLGQVRTADSDCLSPSLAPLKANAPTERKGDQRTRNQVLLPQRRWGREVRQG